MKTTKTIQSLLRLREVEDALAVSQSAPDNFEREREVTRLRKKIPEVVLTHYECLRERGKAPIVEVANGICQGCFLRVPTGLLPQLVGGKELLQCPNCSAYLYNEGWLSRAEDVEGASSARPSRGA